MQFYFRRELRKMIVSNVSLSSCTRSDGAWCTTDGERHLEVSSHGTLSPTGHLVVAICLGFVGTFGFINNLLVLVLFYRYKKLRSPINLLLMNISLSDLLVCVLGTPFSFAASTQGRWLIGPTGCVWYGFANTLFGVVSLITLAVLSYERYCTMMAPTEADDTNYRKTILGIGLSWAYSLMWAVPPLFGWSKYGPEGPGTTCSVNWTAKNVNNISYIICLFFFCLIVPFVVIVYCYGKLLHTIKQVSRGNGTMTRKREQRVLFMVITMVICYLLCWLPYGIMALLATFGHPGLITPEASIIPSILAKSSTVINPIIYIFMNKQFYRCFLALIMCQTPETGSSFKNSSKVNKSFRSVRHAADNNFTVMMTSVGQPTIGIPNLSHSGETKPSLNIQKTAVVSLVAHYNS